MSTVTATTSRRTLYIPEDRDLKIRLVAALKKQSVNELINEILNEALIKLAPDDLHIHFNANE